MDYAEEIRLEASEAELMNKANSATQKTFERRTKGDFTLNWLKTFLKNFSGVRQRSVWPVASDRLRRPEQLIEAIESEGMKSALVTCKLGGLTVKNADKDGVPYEHQGVQSCGTGQNIERIECTGMVVLVGLCIGHDTDLRETLQILCDSFCNKDAPDVWDVMRSFKQMVSRKDCAA